MGKKTKVLEGIFKFQPYRILGGPNIGIGSYYLTKNFSEPDYLQWEQATTIKEKTKQFGAIHYRLLKKEMYSQSIWKTILAAFATLMVALRPQLADRSLNRYIKDLWSGREIKWFAIEIPQNQKISNETIKSIHELVEELYTNNSENDENIAYYRFNNGSYLTLLNQMKDASTLNIWDYILKNPDLRDLL